MSVLVGVAAYRNATVVRRCIESVLDCTREPHRLVVIDDGSEDPELTRWLEIFARNWGCSVLRNRTNRGFVRTANRFFRMSRTDVVLLNSDVVVTPRWLEKMLECAESRPKVGSVTPLTDVGAIFAVPRWNERNGIPSSLSLAEYAARIEQASRRQRPQAPSGGGFCMLFRRAALDAVGLFDEAAFGAGYAEENDWSRRAAGRGFVHLIDDATFVHHEGGASFGDRRAELAAVHRPRLFARHPDYDAHVSRFMSANPLRHVQRSVRAIADGEATPLRVLLLTMRRREGGLPFVRPAERFRVAESVEVVVATVCAERKQVLVEELAGESPAGTSARPLPVGVDAWRREIEELGIDTVHALELDEAAHDALRAAASKALPIVLDWRDFHLACPIRSMIDATGRHCHGCTTLEICDHCLSAERRLPHGSQRAWRSASAEIVALADLHVFGSEDARRIISAIFALPDDRVRILQISAPTPPSALPGLRRVGETAAVRVAFVGEWCREGGSEVVRDLAGSLPPAEFKWHVFGPVRPGHEPSLPASAVVHGPCPRGEIAARLVRAGIDLVVLPSIWPDPALEALEASWRAGLPVLGSSLGAIGERIAATGGGWTIDVHDSNAVATRLRALAADRGAIAAARARIAVPTAMDAPGPSHAKLHRDLAASVPPPPRSRDDWRTLRSAGSRTQMARVAREHVPAAIWADADAWFAARRLLFLIGIGRSGTKWIGHFMGATPRVAAYHEPIAADFEAIFDAQFSLDEARAYFAGARKLAMYELVRNLSVDAYAEANSALRFHVEAVRETFPQATIVHLVRDGREVVRSIYSREHYTTIGHEGHFHFTPGEDDPLHDEWPTLDRFARICWLWSDANRRMHGQADSRLRFEDMVGSYSAFREAIERPLGVEIGEQRWRAVVERPANATPQFKLPPWPEWTDAHHRTFERICGAEMRRLGYF